MNYQKIIKESLFVLNYDRVENPLPKFFSSGSYADYLNHFNEPNTIQTPPGFTDGLPVIVARSKGGHSNLSVSALSSTISSKYDNGFENSLDKCMANLRDKVYPTFYIMEDVTGKSVNKKNRNLQSVENLRKFEEDWNGYGAGSFSAELCDFMEKIIKNLDEEYQPKLFPTGRESIQIEYEKTNGEYLEIEVFSPRRIELFQITADGKEIEKNIGYDEIERAVKTFYGV